MHIGTCGEFKPRKNINYTTNIASLRGIIPRDNNSQDISTPSPDPTNINNTIRTIPPTRDNTIHKTNAGDSIIASHYDNPFTNPTLAPAGSMATRDTHNTTQYTDPINIPTTLQTQPFTRDTIIHSTSTRDNTIASHSEVHSSHTSYTSSVRYMAPHATSTHDIITTTPT